ncbi:MAG: transposase [Patescibacteria group bacterium]
MPAKNSVKTYIENGYYHIYNRGVEKRNIFLDEQDYLVFLSYLKIYLTPNIEAIDAINKNNNLDNEDKNIKIHRLNELKNYSEKINLICYVLMPNHFHLELQQIGKKDIGNFMQSLIAKYTVYFNKKYKRVGSLFQGRYKAVLIFGKEYLINLSKYIHLNPLEILAQGQVLESYSWNSYPAYIQNIKIKWLKKDYILPYFHESKISYKDFVESENDSDKQISLELKKLLLDYDRV